jgi:hypothetical protein
VPRGKDHPLVPMRTVSLRVRIGTMDQPRIVNLRIAFNLDADPIAGHLHAEDEHCQSFCGWIELTRAIELGLAAAGRVRPSSTVMRSERAVTDRPN